ncbi:unnamed protein product, partial [Didymodactylos carnosus]
SDMQVKNIMCAKTSVDSSSSSSTSCSRPPSDFYWACRNGDVKKVKELLSNRTLNDINVEESNGSTALHAASYKGHFEIVQLLLNAGASRSIKNKHKFFPYEEGRTPEIRELFSRTNRNRFGNDDITKLEWAEVDLQAINRRSWLKLNWTKDKMFNTIEWMSKNYLCEKLPDLTEHSTIEYFFKQAETEDSDSEDRRIRGQPKYLIKAYTAETDYYRKFSIDFASEDLDKDWTSSMLQWIVATFYSHPLLGGFSFQGQTYRGAKMSDSDYKRYHTQYKAGKRVTVMNKLFLSTSKDRKVAEEFAIGGNLSKHSVLCKYEIRNDRTALDIESVSEYPQEKEVLILPNTTFKVVKIIEHDKKKDMTRRT